MDKGTWWATVHGVAKSWTWLSDSHFHFFQGKICKIDTEGKGEQCRGRKVTLMTTKGKKSVLQPHTSPWVSTDDACLMNTIDPWERATLLINQSTPRSLLCFGVSPHWQTQVGQGWSQKTSPRCFKELGTTVRKLWFTSTNQGTSLAIQCLTLGLQCRGHRSDPRSGI